MSYMLDGLAYLVDLYTWFYTALQLICTWFYLSLFVRGIELFCYIWIWENYRLFELPWNSVWTWILTLVGVDFGYYWVHRCAHGECASRKPCFTISAARWGEVEHMKLCAVNPLNFYPPFQNLPCNLLLILLKRWRRCYFTGVTIAYRDVFHYRN